MSRFLRHLLQRSIGSTAPAVQPRLASRFESGPSAVRPPEEYREIAVQPSPPRPPSGISFQPPIEGNEIARPIAPVRSPDVSAPVVASAPAPTLTALTFLPVASPALLQVPALPALTSDPVPTVAVPAPGAGLAPLSLPAASPRTLVVERITERRHEVATTPTSLGATAPSTAPVPFVSSSTVPAARNIFPSPLPPAQPFSVNPRPAPPPAPEIRVTIGRVDIRAIHAPAAAAPRAPAPDRPPVVSLEKYLNQRNSA